MSSPLRITEAFDLYRQEYILDHNQSRKTEESHIYACKSLVGFIGDIPIETLTRTMVRDWKSNMESRNKAQGTIRGYMIKLRVVLKYLRLEGHDVLDPGRIVVPKHGPSRIRFLRPEHVKQLIQACDIARSKHLNRARNKAIVALLFSTGLRVSELCRLDRAHLQFDSFSVETKGGDNEVFFVDASARKYVDKYLNIRLDNNAALFVSDQRGKPRVTPGNVREVFKTLRKHTGLNVQPHIMRHSYGTDLMRNKADIRRVQELMHHKSIQTTAQYLHFEDGELQEMYLQYHSEI